MNRSVIMILFVAVLTMTAGCAGVLDDDTTDETNEAVDYPDGTGENGLDAFELESRMMPILENGSYTTEIHETLEYEAGTWEESITLTVDGERKMQKTKLDYEPSTEESVFESSTEKTWLYTESANETLIREVVDSNERYRVERGPTVRTMADRNLRDELKAVLRVSGYELTDKETDDGSTVVTYEGTVMSDELEQLYPLTDEYDEFTATVSVSDRGVERYAYEFEGKTNGNTEPVAVETTFSGIGETELERTEWVEEGFERALEASISIEEEGIIALTMESGEPISENATISLDWTNMSDSSATLDEAVEPGETVYLTVRDEQLLASVDTEPTAGDAIEAEWFTVTVWTENNFIAYEGFYEK